MTKKKILIVDDMQSVRTALRQYLCPPVGADVMLRQLLEKGTMDPTPAFDISEANQGELGVQMAREALESGRPYDIIFMDMMMPPGIAGDAAIRKIREFDIDVGIIVCTALTASTVQELTSANGGTTPIVISKPITAHSNLLAIVEKAVRGTQAANRNQGVA